MSLALLASSLNDRFHVFMIVFLSFSLLFSDVRALKKVTTLAHFWNQLDASVWVYKYIDGRSMERCRRRGARAHTQDSHVC